MGNVDAQIRMRPNSNSNARPIKRKSTFKIPREERRERRREERKAGEDLNNPAGSLVE